MIAVVTDVVVLMVVAWVVVLVEAFAVFDGTKAWRRTVSIKYRSKKKLAVKQTLICRIGQYIPRYIESSAEKISTQCDDGRSRS